MQFVSSDVPGLSQFPEEAVPPGRRVSRFITCGRPINHKRPGIDQSTRDGAPEPAVEAVVAIIAEHEILVIVVLAIAIDIVNATELAVCLELIRNGIAPHRNFERLSYAVPRTWVTNE